MNNDCNILVARWESPSQTIWIELWSISDDRYNYNYNYVRHDGQSKNFYQEDSTHAVNYMEDIVLPRMKDEFRTHMKKVY